MVGWLGCFGWGWGILRSLGVNSDAVVEIFKGGGIKFMSLVLGVIEDGESICEGQDGIMKLLSVDGRVGVGRVGTWRHGVENESTK